MLTVFGIGQTELLIICLVCSFLLFPILIAIGVVVAVIVLGKKL